MITEMIVAIVLKNLRSAVSALRSGETDSLSVAIEFYPPPVSKSGAHDTLAGPFLEMESWIPGGVQASVQRSPSRATRPFSLPTPR